MQIDWWTLALQAINFLVLVWLLSRFLFKPVRESIEKRRALASEKLADADAQKAAAQAALQEYDADREALAKEEQALLGQIRREQEAETKKIVEKAREQAAEILEESRQKIAEERQRSVAEVRAEIADLAVEMAQNLLRQFGSPFSNSRAREVLLNRLKTMSADEKKRLEKELSSEGGCLQVVTAPPLAANEKKQWSNELTSIFGKKFATEFVTDPDIIGGVELRLPHTVFKLTWTDYLRKLAEQLESDETAT